MRSRHEALAVIDPAVPFPPVCGLGHRRRAGREAQLRSPEPADSDAPLPAGFPTATQPGVVEIKTYPVYRSALAKGEGMTVNSSDFLFWSLFRHIETKGVAMTAPVINTYESEQMVDDPTTRGNVTMEFLYEKPDQGEAGQGVGAVQVVDHEPGKFLCLGVQGRMNDKQMKEGTRQAPRAWLDEHKDEWTVAGPPRRLGYHGPMTPVAAAPLGSPDPRSSPLRRRALTSPRSSREHNLRHPLRR